MAYKIIWSDLAITRLEGMAEFIARGSPDRAANVVARIYHRVELLADFPMSGRAVPEVQKPTVREVIVPPYRVIYKLTSQAVIVWNILHSAEDFRKIKRELRRLK